MSRLRCRLGSANRYREVHRVWRQSIAVVTLGYMFRWLPSRFVSSAATESRDAGKGSGHATVPVDQQKTNSYCAEQRRSYMSISGRRGIHPVGDLDAGHGAVSFCSPLRSAAACTATRRQRNPHQHLVFPSTAK